METVSSPQETSVKTSNQEDLFKERRILNMKRWLFGLVMLSFLSMFIIACTGNSDANASGSTSGGSNEVYTQGANFVQSSITLTKGSMLTLIDDDSTFHIINNGSTGPLSRHMRLGTNREQCAAQ